MAAQRGMSTNKYVRDREGLSSFSYTFALVHLLFILPLCVALTYLSLELVGDIIYSAVLLPLQWKNKRHRRLY